MFYSDNPARDWDDYCEYQERLNKEWHEENDSRIEEEIIEIKMQIEDLEIDLKNATNEDEKWDIECRIEELQSDIKRLEEELADEQSILEEGKMRKELFMNGVGVMAIINDEFYIEDYLLEGYKRVNKNMFIKSK